MPRKARPVLVRFWELVDKNGDLPDQSIEAYTGMDRCWHWTGNLDKDGYGRFAITHSRTLRAHRASYEINTGPIPDGHCILHRCDNTRCVNPSHLTPGTLIDNNKDMKAKGRHAEGERSGSRTKPERIPRGERHGNAKLTEDDVRAIRASSEPGWVLAARYGLTNRNTPNFIRSRRAWKHIQ